MVVTHLFQVLAFVAMEAPTSLEPVPISEEKNKVFRSLLPIEPTHVVRGQYSGYRAEPGVDPGVRDRNVHCPQVRNRQLALGRRAVLPAHRQAYGGGSERIISIAFREPPKTMFPAGSGVGEKGPDHLTFDLADASKMSLSFYGQRPGPGMRLDS